MLLSEDGVVVFYDYEVELKRNRPDLLEIKAVDKKICLVVNQKFVIPLSHFDLPKSESISFFLAGNKSVSILSEIFLTILVNSRSLRKIEVYEEIFNQTGVVGTPTLPV